MDGTLIRLKRSVGRFTAGIIVIGDEILKAQVKDTNSFYACKLLYKHGIKVDKISVVRDEVKDIAGELKMLRKRYNYIVTSGGIGPTHDDVTYEAAALAFDDTLHYHPTLVDIVKNQFDGKTCPSAAYKMSYVPTKSVLKFGTDRATGQPLRYPCVTMENVYMFPGSPVFFEMSFQAVCKECLKGKKSFATAKIFLNAREEAFANVLSAVALELRNVSFGSYPEHNRYYKVRITVESEEEKDTEAAVKMFCERVPKNMVVAVEYGGGGPDVDLDRSERNETLTERSKGRSVSESPLKKFVSYYRRPEEVCVYLDGSEESVVMIHLARIALDQLAQHTGGKLYAFCLKSDLSESDGRNFFSELCDRCNVELEKLNDENIDAIGAVRDLAASKPKLRVLLVGKRLTGKKKEAYDSLAQLNGSDSAIAVQVDFPLIDWSDEDVSSFLNSLPLPRAT